MLISSTHRSPIFMTSATAFLTVCFHPFKRFNRYDLTDCDQVMRCFLETGTFGDTLICAIDAKVAIWQSLLPACKKDPLQPDGRVDEVMFMAHMIAAM